MKIILFLASAAGLVCALYCLASDFIGGCAGNNLLFTGLLVLLLFNSIVGLVLTYPRRKKDKRTTDDADNSPGNKK